MPRSTDFGVPGLVGVGIASAGPLDAEAGTVSPVNIGCVAGVSGWSLTSQQRYPGVPVTLLGDRVSRRGR